MTNNYICVTCGVQYAESEGPPEHCLICEDERQYIGINGQQWTTLQELRANRRNSISEDEPGLTGITTEPAFAIGQRARLIQSPGGNVLWECTSFIDNETVEAVRKLGGISAIAISHPHFYSSIVEWSKAFGGVPVYVHGDDRQWVMRPDPTIVFWDGERRELGESITLVRCGGHFPGSSVLHWAAGADGRGALLTGDTIYVVSDRRYVRFMYSYPNLIPLNASAVQRIVDAVEPLEFDRIYSSWVERVVRGDAKGAVRQSAERYLRAIG
jgi:glyoxylase-like metal-dependent hydrolase (beta-lactamase superfamily II)